MLGKYLKKVCKIRFKYIFLNLSDEIFTSTLNDNHLHFYFVLFNIALQEISISATMQSNTVYKKVKSIMMTDFQKYDAKGFKTSTSCLTWHTGYTEHMSVADVELVDQ